MPGLIDLQIGYGSTRQYAVASLRIDGFAKLGIWAHIYNGITPGLSLCGNCNRAERTSIFMRARWVDRRGELYEADSLHVCSGYLGHARTTLASLLTNPGFAADSIQPLLRAIKDQFHGRMRVAAANDPDPPSLIPPPRRSAR